jgi:hypothetical protein
MQKNVRDLASPRQRVQIKTEGEESRVHQIGRFRGSLVKGHDQDASKLQFCAGNYKVKCRKPGARECLIYCRDGAKITYLHASQIVKNFPALYPGSLFQRGGREREERGGRKGRAPCYHGPNASSDRKTALNMIKNKVK